MAKAKEWPAKVKVGAAVVTVYRIPKPKAKDGWMYQIYSAGMKSEYSTDGKDALEKAKIRAGKINTGQIEAAGLSNSDREELVEARRLAGSVPLVSAVKEWAEAARLTGGHVLAAAKQFAVQNSKGFSPILIEDALAPFIKSRGEGGDSTYRTKIEPAVEFFRGRELHGISAIEWERFLSERYPNGASFNDYRKKIGVMCGWAQQLGYIPRGSKLEIRLVPTREEADVERGIILPDTYAKLLRYLRHYHPEYLAAAVIHGLLGLRASEIHGSRKKKGDKRQLWSDIHLDLEEPSLIVTNAKHGTKKHRSVPIPPAALEWLKLIPSRSGNVCNKYAMNRVRDIGKTAGLNLPDNCFRHSYISYQLVLGVPKDKVADWAGNSPGEIDEHYRRVVFAENSETLALNIAHLPLTKKIAKAWFDVTPAYAESVEHLPLSPKFRVQIISEISAPDFPEVPANTNPNLPRDVE